MDLDPLLRTALDDNTASGQIADCPDLKLSPLRFDLLLPLRRMRDDPKAGNGRNRKFRGSRRPTSP